MNKRQWKKYHKKKWEATKKYWGIDKWESNIVFQNIADQIINGKIDDCGIIYTRKLKDIIK